MDFDAETWDVSEEANKLSELLFIASPTNVKKKNKKKSVEKSQQETPRPFYLLTEDNNVNDDIEDVGEPSGKSKAKEHGKKRKDKQLTTVNSPNSDDGDNSFSNYTVLKNKKENDKKGSGVNKSGHNQNTDRNNKNETERNFGKLKESDIIEGHIKGITLKKMTEDNKANRNDLKESRTLGEQPKKKKRKQSNGTITMSPSEEYSSSNVDDLVIKTSSKTVDKVNMLNKNEKYHRTGNDEKDSYKTVSHLKNKEKRKHFLSNDSVENDSKNEKDSDDVSVRLQMSTGMETPSPSKKKKKANIFGIDKDHISGEGTIKKDMKNPGIDLKNDDAGMKDETTSKQKTGNDFIQSSQENDKTKKKRKRKKKNKSHLDTGVDDIKQNSINNNWSSICNKESGFMHDNSENSESEKTLKDSITKLGKKDIILQGKTKHKKIKLDHSDESSDSESSDDDHKITKVMSDKKHSNEFNNKKEKLDLRDIKSSSMQSLPFTPLKIKELLAKTAKNTAGKQKVLVNAEKGSNLDFNRSKQISENSVDKQTKQKKLTNDKDAKTRSLFEQNMGKLEAARFRFINEQLYTRTGAEALELFNDDPEAFEVYHKGFQNQVEKWPVNPVDVIIDFVSSLPSNKIVADFGCGDAKLAQSVPNKVHSFDLVAINKHVTVCDISNVPLSDHSVDVAVFCLSLMGTNFSSYLSEANRVLKKGGTLIIAEVASRFHKLTDFLGDLKKLGFKSIEQDTKNAMFVLMKFEKKTTLKKTVIKQMKLKPCVYKKR